MIKTVQCPNCDNDHDIDIPDPEIALEQKSSTDVYERNKAELLEHLDGHEGALEALREICRERSHFHEVAQNVVAREMKTVAEAERRGIEIGIQRYAWWKDGVQYVGSCGTTLEKALQEHRGHKT